MRILFLFLLILSLLGALGWVLRVRRREESFLKKSTRDTLSVSLKTEIEKEKADSQRKRELFEQELDRFKQGVRRV